MKKSPIFIIYEIKIILYIPSDFESYRHSIIISIKINV